jgi:hypothetical protein
MAMVVERAEVAIDVKVDRPGLSVAGIERIDADALGRNRLTYVAIRQNHRGSLLGMSSSASVTLPTIVKDDRSGGV